MTTVTLRPANEEDRAFIFDSYKTALKPYVDWAWGWNEAFQRNGFWRHHPCEQFRIIAVDGEMAGAIHTEEQETLNFVRIIFLLPEFQNHGVGSELLLDEADRANQAGKQLHLKVIKINPAKNLYERLGFVTIEEDNATFHMRLV